MTSVLVPYGTSSRLGPEVLPAPCAPCSSLCLPPVSPGQRRNGTSVPGCISGRRVGLVCPPPALPSPDPADPPPRCRRSHPSVSSSSCTCSLQPPSPSPSVSLFTNRGRNVSPRTLFQSRDCGEAQGAWRGSGAPQIPTPAHPLPSLPSWPLLLHYLPQCSGPDGCPPTRPPSSEACASPGVPHLPLTPPLFSSPSGMRPARTCCRLLGAVGTTFRRCFLGQHRWDAAQVSGQSGLAQRHTPS